MSSPTVASNTEKLEGGSKGRLGVCKPTTANRVFFPLTLRVPAMQDGQGDGAVHLVLAGDNGGVEQSPLGSIVEGIGERDGGTEVDRLYHQIHTLDTTANQLGIVPFKKKKKTQQKKNNKAFHPQIVVFQHHKDSSRETQSDLDLHQVPHVEGSLLPPKADWQYVHNRKAEHQVDTKHHARLLTK